ncbi:MAG: zf-HC2 domain-containing protein [Chlamydiota bacterium]|nr:zf-HC2 domain-containing protein [Chlamydiota bacterium]
MNCKQFKDILYEYLQGNLDEKQYQLAQEHARHCSACLQEMDFLNHQLLKLKNAKVHAPDEKVWQAIKEAITKELPRNIVPMRRITHSSFLKIASVAALILVSASSWFYLHQSPVGQNNHLDAYLEDHAVFIAELSDQTTDTLTEDDQDDLLFDGDEEDLDFGTLIEDYFLS